MPCSTSPDEPGSLRSKLLATELVSDTAHHNKMSKTRRGTLPTGCPVLISLTPAATVTNPNPRRTMILTFNATYHINGQPHETTMTYDTADAAATLRRRLTTAFPNATNITLELVAPAKAGR